VVTMCPWHHHWLSESTWAGEWGPRGGFFLRVSNSGCEQTTGLSLTAVAAIVFMTAIVFVAVLTRDSDGIEVKFDAMNATFEVDCISPWEDEGGPVPFADGEWGDTFHPESTNDRYMAWRRSRVQFPLAPRNAAGHRPAVLSFSVLTLAGSNAGSSQRRVFGPRPPLRRGEEESR